MAENYFLINLLQLCKTELKDSPDLDNFITRINNLKLTPSEEKFITALFHPDADDFDTTLETYEVLLPIIRGQDGVNAFWFSTEELSKIAFNRELLEDGLFFNKVMRSVFLYREKEFPTLAVILANVYLDFVGDSWVPEIKSPYDFYYLRLFLLLLEKYFNTIEEKWQLFFMSSKWLYYYISIGLDLDNIMNNSILDISYIKGRQDLSFQLAVALLANETLIGSDEKGVGVNFAYWLEKFQGYRQQEVPGLRMASFLSDVDIWKNSSPDEKEVIKQLLMVYINLVGDFYIYKDISEKDIEIVKKENEVKVQEKKVDYSEIIKEVETKFKSDTDGQFLDLGGVLGELENLSKKYNDAKIKDLYFFEENEGKFKWSI